MLIAGSAGAGVILAVALLGVTAHDRGTVAPADPEAVLAIVRTTSLPAAAADIGLAGDAAADSSGRLYVLDVLRNRIGVLDAGADHFAWAGQAGQGPGEFVAPSAMAVSASGRIFAADRATRRLEQYTATAAGLRRTGAVTLDFIPQDVCTIGERVFVLGARGEWAIHEISPRDGSVLRSFARDRQLSDPLLATHRDGGYLSCGPGDEIDFLPLLRPRVHRYSARTGREVSVSEIPGYREIVVRRDAASVTLSDPPEGSADCAAGLVRLRSGDLLIQVGTVRPGATIHEFDEIRSFVLARHGNTVRAARETLPRFVAPAARGLVAVRTDPDPAVWITTLDLDDGGTDER